MSRMNVWSCGGGTQSAAIAALIVRGRIPKPDIALMVDTEREKSSTWEYVNGVLIPALATVGVDLHVVKKSDFATVDLYGGKDGKTLLLPVFTTQENPDGGKLSTYCSGEWKRDVSHRWLRAQGVKECRTWIGISRDEMRRVRVSRRAWNQNFYPLIEAEFALYYNRLDCIREVEGMGWPTPPRSACWMCPNMGRDEWLDMKTHQPKDFALAVELEREIRQSDPHAYLHKSCVPLDEVDWDADETTVGVAGGCEGMCFV